MTWLYDSLRSERLAKSDVMKFHSRTLSGLSMMVLGTGKDDSLIMLGAVSVALSARPIILRSSSERRGACGISIQPSVDQVVRRRNIFRKSSDEIVIIMCWSFR